MVLVHLLAAVTTLADPVAARRQIETELASGYSRLETVYRDLHAHPELGFEERRTAAVLAREMRALGFDVTEGVGRTGVVAIYRNGPGPTVMVRTELDGLPIEETTGLSYTSRAKGMWQGKEGFIAHACGHDIHMAAWLGAAAALVRAKLRWSGTLAFVAQPDEEGSGGAKAMISDGLFTRFAKPDYAFALHVGSDPVGTITYKSGTLTATSDSFDITFIGKGGHGSAPSGTIDPVMMAGRFIVDVQSVVSREKLASAFGVITIGAVHAGSAGNVIPDLALLSGTIRSWDAEVRAKLLLGVSRTARAVAEMSAAPAPEIGIKEGAEAVYNDPSLAARTGAVLKAAFGEQLIETTTVTSGSEDFSAFVAAGVPGFYFGIGGLDPQVVARARAAGSYPPGNHNPAFAPVAEPAIRTGATALALAVLNVMDRR